jgi:hypothetical protein
VDKKKIMLGKGWGQKRFSIENGLGMKKKVGTEKRVGTEKKVGTQNRLGLIKFGTGNVKRSETAGERSEPVVCKR